MWTQWRELIVSSGELGTETLEFDDPRVEAGFAQVFEFQETLQASGSALEAACPQLAGAGE